MTKLALAFLCLLFVPALADDCRKTADVRRSVEASGGSVRDLTTRELDFARGLYVAQPNTPATMPEGEAALLIQFQGRVLVTFVRGALACELMNIGADGQRNFDRLAHGPGDPS